MLQSWAVLDTHMYLAWEHSAPDTWSCETDPEETKNGIARFVQAKVNEMNDAAARNGIAHTAVSEWSLATNHDSAAGCQDARVLEALREAQRYAFDQGGVESYFWGWKLPSAGAHQKFWSAQFHGAEMAAAAAAAAGEAEADAAAASDDVPAEAEGIAAVEDADDAGVALASEAAEPEPEAKEAASEVAEDASGDIRAEPVEPAEPAKEAPSEPTDGREDEAAEVVRLREQVNRMLDALLMLQRVCRKYIARLEVHRITGWLALRVQAWARGRFARIACGGVTREGRGWPVTRPTECLV